MSRNLRLGRARGSGDDDLPPPPPPTPSDLLAMLVEGQRALGDAMRTLAHHQAPGHNQRQGPEPNQFSVFKEFQDTKPLVFKEAEEPLQAEEWLNTLEHKFYLLRVTEQMKAEYASHQLQGPAGIWWRHYRSTLPENAQVTWNQF